MAYNSTSPLIYDDMRSFSVSTLLRLKILLPNVSKSERLIWTRDGQEIASINIKIVQPQNIMTLSYEANGEPIKYDVKLETEFSNLGFGKVWYFVCPATGKRCKKLFGGKYFLSRHAYPDALYEKQTYSKYGRALDKAFSQSSKLDKLYSELNSRYFKTHYADRETARYKRILTEINKAETGESNFNEIINRVFR